ncbi:hypothetical protein ACFQ1S_18080 [Kibdelosporangium lantanae]|uniref:ABC transporter permease n=1 Tax=Kibdelosporangium lantanae TaxID=1497396 RepID=A0ABW3M9U0_9PSEU
MTTVVERAQVSWRDWLWITWRQHRKSIIGLTVITATAFLLFGPLAYRTSRNLGGVTDTISLYTPTALSVLVALFWAAPMIAREYEDRTVVFSWTQDVRPWQWVFGRAVPPLVIGVVLIAVLNFEQRARLDPVEFNSQLYEANPYLHTTYVVFGFVLGLVFGAWLRQTPGAIGGTLVAFLGFRILMSTTIRPYLVAPQVGNSAYIDLFDGSRPPEAPSGAYIVDSGYIDSATGGRASVPSLFVQECVGTDGDTLAATACFRQVGVSGHFTKYQPIEAMWKMQVLEGLIYLAAAGLLVALLRKLLDRRQRI